MSTSREKADQSQPSLPPELPSNSGKTPWRILAIIAFIIAFVVASAWNANDPKQASAVTAAFIFGYILPSYIISFGVAMFLLKGQRNPRTISIFLLGWSVAIIASAILKEYIQMIWVGAISGIVFAWIVRRNLEIRI